MHQQRVTDQTVSNEARASSRTSHVNARALVDVILRKLHFSRLGLQT